MAVTPAPFVSYAQNGEDVVLWRALEGVSAGRYVEVGANHPRDDSVTRAFYDRGWSGITIEPVPYFADLQRAERPRDHLVQAAITNTGRGQITLPVDLLVSTLRLDDVLAESGWAGEEIHFMLIDVEGAERDVLQSVDLRRWRPWVLVVEATEPNSTVTTHSEWEPGLIAQGYQYCLFDGVSRFYVADEKADLLRAALSYPACVLDNYQTPSLTAAMRERRELLQQIAHWRTIALTGWADAVSQAPGPPRGAGVDADFERTRRQLLAMQSTLSWRITRPLRGVRRVIDLARGR